MKQAASNDQAPMSLENASGRRSGVWFASMGCALMLAFVAGWASVLTYAAWSRGLLNPSVLLTEPSPDGLLQVVVTKQVRLPVMRFTDPAVTVRALVKTKDGGALSKAETGLCEDSDYRFPQINWRKDEVVLAGLDQRNASRTLRVPIGAH